ncbi:hypothetical protein PR202_ga09812 [Eleusine coracana subsp. coracana]|uniref:Uncharacterized protein n=1 Tax=Eleusine coracana subsp. coracana TaxID=191504 RepID=A0AAV5C5D3_ELECO|nr:hypothetical protein PR202_ga09812 [Eleusine coracana subsp. coracana]
MLAPAARLAAASSARLHAAGSRSVGPYPKRARALASSLLLAKIPPPSVAGTSLGGYIREEERGQGGVGGGEGNGARSGGGRGARRGSRDPSSKTWTRRRGRTRSYGRRALVVTVLVRGGRQHIGGARVRGDSGDGSK